MTSGRGPRDYGRGRGWAVDVGRGLSAAAVSRRARRSSTGVATSFLSVSAALGARSVGFDLVGDVMGAVAGR